MSGLPNFPDLPSNVGDQAIPDFLNFKVIGKPKSSPVPEKFNFAVKESPLFGVQQGSKFDEGKLWHPIQALEFGCDKEGLKSFRGHYASRKTRYVGPHNIQKHMLHLGHKEYVSGISGTLNKAGVMSLTVHTSERQVHVVKGSHGGENFEYHVPKDHHVVAFNGTETGDRITSLGVAYTRRLESISDLTAVGDGPTPVLTGLQPTQWLDAPTQAAWAKNDMATIENLRSQASNDLMPIYTNIDQHGNDAWVEVQAPDGEIYYVSYTTNGVIWSYLKTVPSVAGREAAVGDNPPTKDAIVSIGSYSKTANFLGISVYNWSNVPTTIISGVIALGFAYLVRPILQIGIEMGIAAGANLLAEGLAAAGVEAAAVLVPASVATVGGLVLAGIVGVALMLGCIALASVLFRQYFLIMNIYNFDGNHTYSTLGHYEDNSEVSNGSWKDATITKFVPAGQNIAPPGFDPVKTLDNVVTYLNVNFQNDSTFLQALGEGILLGRDDAQSGVAVKYDIRRFSDNQIGAQGISGSPVQYDLSNYYKNGQWVTAQNTSTSAGGLNVTGYTPALGGAKDQTYTYEVNIGLPPPPVSV